MTRYGGLRAAQRDVTERVLGQGASTTTLLGNVGTLANMADLHPVLLEQLHPVRPWMGETVRLELAPIGPAPWPAPTHGWYVWPTTDRPAYLAWLANDPLPKPSIPSIGELVEAGRDLSARIMTAQKAAGLAPLSGPRQVRV